MNPACRARQRLRLAIIILFALSVALTALSLARRPGIDPGSLRQDPGRSGAANPLPRTAAGKFPDTWNGIHLGVTLATTVLAGGPLQPRMGRKVDYIWSSSSPPPLASRALDGAHVDHYLAATWNDFGTTDERAHSLRWFQMNHPDWVAYRCENDRPSTTPAWYGYGTSHQSDHVPLDWSNRQVQDYLIAQAKAQLAKGYDGISVDNVLFTNFQAVCGTYRWVTVEGRRSMAWRSSDYPSTNTTNAKIVSDLLSFYSRLSKELQKSYPDRSLMANSSALIAGVPLQQFSPFFDGVLDEIGVMGKRQERVTGAAWQVQVRQAEQLAAMRKAYVMVSYANAGGVAPVMGPQRDSVVNWVLANYLLVKGHNSYTYVHRLAPGFVDLPQYDIPIGTPVGPRVSTNGTQQRWYTGGLVLVNPSATAAAEFRLPQPMNDLTGKTLYVARLGPATGLVLLHRTSR